MKGDEVYDLLAKGLVERIGMEVGCLKHQAAGKEKIVKEMPIADHTVGIKAVLEALTDKESGCLSTLEDIEAVGHRVVHGGEEFFCSQLIDENVIAQIEKCSDIAPLHNPANLLGIRAVSDVLPTVPQVAVFDTAFHQSMPEYAYMYALPYEYYDKYRIRRYGFHGTSHRYVSAKGAKFAGLDLGYSKIITCHLGNGASVSAINGGKVMDTSMGFTPLEGLVMGTRTGDMDPAAVLYIMKNKGYTPDEMDTYVNKKSGLLGVSGISNDFRDIEAAMDEGNERAQLAYDMFVLRVKKYIGAYYAELNGCDAIVFTAGIGENDVRVRASICADLEALGIAIDADKNSGCREFRDISAEGAKAHAFVIPTNEEYAIALETVEAISEAK